MTEDKITILEQVRNFFTSLGCEVEVNREDDRTYVYIDSLYELGFADDGELYSGEWLYIPGDRETPPDYEFKDFNEKTYACASVNIANKIIAYKAYCMTEALQSKCEQKYGLV